MQGARDRLKWTLVRAGSESWNAGNPRPFHLFYTDV